MDSVTNFLIDNYYYFAGIAFMLILALVGYIIDQRKTRKIRSEFEQKQKENYTLPIASINENLTLGTTINNRQSENNNEVKTPTIKDNNKNEEGNNL